VRESIRTVIGGDCYILHHLLGQLSQYSDWKTGLRFSAGARILSLCHPSRPALGAHPAS